MKKKISKILSLVIATSMILVGCASNSTNQSQEKKEEKTDEKKIKVIASMYPMYDFASKIAGDKADVENIIPNGTEAHGWEPSPADITKLEEADVFVYNGAGMEGWVDKVLESLSNKDLIKVEASDGIDLIKNEDDHEHDHHHDDHEHNKDHKHDDKDHDHDKDHKHDEHDKDHKHEDDHKHDEKQEAHKQEHHDEHDHHHHGEFDPHVWLSIRDAKKEMENIKNALVQADPENKDYYEENYQKYSKEFDELDKLFEETLKPYAGKSIVVAHEAFAYLGKDYGISQLGIEGVYEDSEPDPARMKEIVEFVKENDVKVIFFETLATPKVSEVIAKETGATTDVLNPIEGLSEDEVKEGKEYISIMKDNLKAIENSFK